MQRVYCDTVYAEQKKENHLLMAAHPYLIIFLTSFYMYLILIDLFPSFITIVSLRFY